MWKFKKFYGLNCIYLIANEALPYSTACIFLIFFSVNDLYLFFHWNVSVMFIDKSIKSYFFFLLSTEGRNSNLYTLLKINLVFTYYFPHFSAMELTSFLWGTLQVCGTKEIPRDEEGGSL